MYPPLGWFASPAWVVCILRQAVSPPLNISSPTLAPEDHGDRRGHFDVVLEALGVEIVGKSIVDAFH